MFRRGLQCSCFKRRIYPRYSVTYVIDEEGVVRHVFSSQLGVTKHVEEALMALGSIG